MKLYQRICPPSRYLMFGMRSNTGGFFLKVFAADSVHGICEVSGNSIHERRQVLFRRKFAVNTSQTSQILAESPGFAEGVLSSDVLGVQGACPPCKISLRVHCSGSNCEMYRTRTIYSPNVEFAETSRRSRKLGEILCCNLKPIR